MSTASARFDTVHDTQRVFRVLLDALARPGKLYDLPSVGPLFSRSRSASLHQFQFLGAVLSTLLDHEVSFCLPDQSDVVHELSEQIVATTGSRSVERDQADYVVTLQPPQASLLSQLNPGNLLYPDTATTLICQVPFLAASAPSEQNGTLLAFEGPGVAERQTVWVADTDATFFNALRAVNAGYPLGIDVIWLTIAGRVMGLPRSTQLTVLEG